MPISKKTLCLYQRRWTDPEIVLPPMFSKRTPWPPIPIVYMLLEQRLIFRLVQHRPLTETVHTTMFMLSQNKLSCGKNLEVSHFRKE